MKFLFAVFMGLSLNAFADHHEGMDKKMESMSFEDAKKMRLERMDMRSKMMEEHKSCVSAAKDKDGLKACMKNMKEDRHEMKSEMKEKIKALKKK